ncbi:SPOR domain-containing protein [Cytobacillus dafuensis]|uniref:SPOR domain-containing protein n=1 Tax=Cytobacillus dafuensis TaxID=1742359 RepID=A0A5B8Z942_CYTDA|nr:SPOR domain-containing protein [Cytobacillus dafuensis]QED48793.1 SPOR domain-containing protein [Cytobacillus dafuensis]
MVNRPDKERTITIKINGNQRSYEENKIPENKLNQEDLENDRLIVDEDQKVNFDYFSSNEAAATKETTDDDNFDWILPEDTFEQPDLVEYKIATQSKKSNKKGLSAFGSSLKKNNRNGLLTSVFITVFFAILLGTSFGIIMLKLVKTENTTETELPVIAEPAPEEKEEGSETVFIKPLSTFVIQGGVFSTVESAKQVQEDYIQKGIPSQIIEMNEQAVLYLSVANSIEDAKELGQQLKGKDIEVFAKPVTFEEKSINGLLPEEKKFIEAAPFIFEIMTAGATEAAVDNSISEETLNNIEKQAAILKAIKTDQFKDEGIISLKSELDLAYAQLKAYSESNDSNVLTKLQQHLLRVLSTFQSIS